MKEEALKLADKLDLIAKMIAIGDRIKWGQDSELMENGSAMIRRLVEELDYLKDQISFYELKDLGNQTKPLSDEELNKAFDYYCETDEGVLRFNYELRDEWKKEQLSRWKEAFKKASER